MDKDNYYGRLGYRKVLTRDGSVEYLSINEWPEPSDERYSVIAVPVETEDGSYVYVEKAAVDCMPQESDEHYRNITVISGDGSVKYIDGEQLRAMLQSEEERHHGQVQVMFNDNSVGWVDDKQFGAM